MIAYILKICFKQKVIDTFEKTRKKMLWNGMIRIYQMNYLKTLVNPVALILIGSGSMISNWAIIVMLVLIAGYSAHILFIYHDIIEEERSGLLIKDLKSGGKYWLYFPMFLLRRIVYIFVPLLIKRLDY
jgi:hypothetical protein